MLDLKDIFIYLLLISYSCTISAVDSKSGLIYPQIKYKNEKHHLKKPFELYK